MHRLAFFAKNDIAIGEELCFNYMGLKEEKEEECSEFTDDDEDPIFDKVIQKKCFCDAKKCLGFIPFS